MRFDALPTRCESHPPSFGGGAALRGVRLAAGGVNEEMDVPPTGFVRPPHTTVPISIVSESWRRAGPLCNDIQPLGCRNVTANNV